MSTQENLERSLSKLEPVELEIVNESAAHRGHSAYKDASKIGESHFFIRIVSPKFVGLSTLAQHRLVYEALSEELAGPVHALALETQAPLSKKDNKEQV